MPEQLTAEHAATRLTHTDSLGIPVGLDSLRPPQRTSVPSLVLAGDWSATDWSATMESAAQSAAIAVDLLLAEWPLTARKS